MKLAPPRAVWVWPSLMLVLVVAFVYLGRFHVQFPIPPAILVTLVVYSASRDGMLPGVLSSAFSLLYVAYYFSVPGEFFHYRETEDLVQVLIWGVAAPTSALMVGKLRRDLGEEHQAKQWLERLVKRKSEELDVQVRKTLNEAFNDVPQIVWTTSATGQIEYLNRLWFDYTGLTPEKMKDLEVWDSVIHPDDRSSMGDKWFAAMRSGTVFEAQCRFRSKDGEYRWHLLRAMPFKGFDGTISKWFGTSTDIHGQKMAEEAALLAKQHLELVLNSVPTVLWAADLNEVYTLAEGHGLASLGRRPSEMVGTKLSDDPMITPEALMLVRRALAGETITTEGEAFGRWYQRLLTPVRDIDGKIKGMVGISTDITSSRRAREEQVKLKAREQAANEASRLKSEFLAHISHEIRTPLNGVIGMSSLLAETRLETEQRAYLDSIRRSAAALMDLLNDVLDLSKIEAGKLEFEKVEFDVHALIDDVNRMFVFSAQSKGLEFVTTVDAEVPRVISGDAGRIRQVLTNLVSNAIKFTQSGKVQVSVELASQGGKELRIEVMDSGIGIPAKAIDKMFSPFSQADSSTSRKFGGTGLGLSICKHLVEGMGGRISVRSVDGKGSRFWFTLPFSSSTNPAGLENEQGQSTLPKLSSQARVLVAEDNLINQVIVVKQLERMGLRVRAVSNGVEALDALGSEPYDLVFMDCQMPEMDGYEVTRRIRAAQDAPYRRIPIVAMTAHAVQGEREKCLAEGMNDYFTKPFRPEVLFEMINKWVNPKAVDSEVVKSLLELDAGKGDVFKRLVALYLESTPERVAKLKTAFEGRTVQRLKFESHALRSSAANLGAHRLAELFKEMEAFSSLDEADQVAKASELLKQIDEEHAAVSSELTEACRSS